jgi:hypothetical protein
MEQIPEGCCQNSQKIPTIPAPERIRTCTTTLKNIIRPDLPQEHTDLLIQRLEKTAMDLINLKGDLVGIIRAQMYQACTRGFLVDQGAIHLDNSQNLHSLNIKEPLPECKVRNKDTLVDEEYIPVTPVLADIPKTIATKDFYKLFTFEFVQRVFTRDISASHGTSMSGALHPLCEELRINIPFAVIKLPGLFTTSNNSVSEMATNITNIWQGSLFDYSLKRILLIYYRSALGPNREQRHMDMTIKKAIQAANIKNARQANLSRSSNRQKARKEKKFQEK